MKILMVGDTHGLAADVIDKLHIAKKLGADRIVVLGDFGLWWGYDGVEFVDEINEAARAMQMFVFALPGNHENYDWWNSVIANARTSRQTSRGFAYLRTNVLLSPRVHNWRWAGKQFVIAGGAVSIDKDWRLERQREYGDQLWSPDEQLTDAEVQEIRSWRLDKVDYLLTHDCSDKTPFHTRMKPDIDSKIHRQRIDEVLKITKPDLHFHGHMHTVYDWENLVDINHKGEAGWTQTYGLECNNDYNSWVLLDTDDDCVTWPRGFDPEVSGWRRGETGDGTRF